MVEVNYEKPNPFLTTFNGNLKMNNVIKSINIEKISS